VLYFTIKDDHKILFAFKHPLDFY